MDLLHLYGMQALIQVLHFSVLGSQFLMYFQIFWLGMQPFKSLFLRLYQLFTKHDAPICDFH